MLRRNERGLSMGCLNERTESTCADGLFSNADHGGNITNTNYNDAAPEVFFPFLLRQCRSSTIHIYIYICNTVQ